ncbi:MAG: alpha-2-macroglobulin family protein, partial [Pirellulaceae bacterium]
MNVKIAIQRPAGDNTLTPGQPVPVTITTTDPQGNPVSAEVSLAMIENSLLSRFPATLEKISDFFRGSPRRWAVRTGSSVEFSYRPVTKPINAQLLAEADRRELEAEEKRLLAAGEVRNNRALRPIDVDEGADLFAESVSDPAFDALHATIDGQSGFSSNLLFGMDGGMSGGMSGGMGGAMGGGNFGGRFTGGFGGGGADLKDESSTPDQLLAEKGLDPFGRQPNTSAATTPQLSGNGNSLGEMSTTLSLVISQSQEIAPSHWGYQAIDPRLALKSRFAGRGPLAGKNRREVQVLQPDGTSWFLTLKGRSDKELAAAVDQLAQAGAVLLPHLSAQETGYWNPAITTNEKGLASVTVTLPERTTAWTLRAKGITLNTMAGQAEEEVIVKKDLFGQLKLPMAFTDGDQANVGVTVHNDALDAGEIEVTLRTTIGDKSSVEKKVLTVKSRGVHELNFLQDFKLPVQDIKQGVPGAKAVFALTVRAGERNDTVERTVPIQPDGMLVYSIATGSTASSITAFIDPPAGIAPASQQLQVIIGPTVEQSLLDVLLAPPTWCQSVSGKLASGADSAVSDLMAALALQQLLSATRDAESPHTQSLDTRIRSSISLLVTVQGNNGGWSWAGQHGGSDRYASARVMWGLSLAKKAGYRVADDTFSRAINFLQTQLGKAQVNDYETKALLLHALATAGQADFPLANQLYRNRQSLSETALAHLSLAFAGMDRKQTAAELLTLLNQKNPAGSGPQGKNKPAHLSWTQSPVELQALHALALDQITPADGRLQSQINWLMAHRTGHRWAPDKATGPAMLATCRWFARTRFQGERYKLTVFVNDQQAVEMEIDDQSQTRTFDIPTRMLDKEKQRVRFQLTGRGRYTYQCVLGGFASSNNIKSSTNRWKVTRYYQPSALEMDGQAIPRGFGILAGNYTDF